MNHHPGTPHYALWFHEYIALIQTRLALSHSFSHSFSLPFESIQIPFRLHTCLIVQYFLSILLLPSNFDFKIFYCTSEFTDIYFNILQTKNKTNPAAGVKIPYLICVRMLWAVLLLILMQTNAPSLKTLQHCHTVTWIQSSVVLKYLVVRCPY